MQKKKYKTMNQTGILKKILLSIAVIILLALDWAALHDIIKGEENLTLEYSIVVFSAGVFVCLFWGWVRKRDNII
jgi:predicted Co/Zn/Cd cation transporter (cation efflux family)